MARTRPARRLSDAAKAGLRDMPSNAIWLISKGLKPAGSVASGASSAATTLAGNVSDTAASAAGSAGSATSSVRQKARRAKHSVAEVVPGVGADPVASLMRQADAAAERAHEDEARAVSLAQQAKDSADEAASVVKESEQFVRQVRADAERTAAARVAQVRSQTAEQVAEVVRERDERVRRAREEAEERVKAERTDRGRPGPQADRSRQGTGRSPHPGRAAGRGAGPGASTGGHRSRQQVADQGKGPGRPGLEGSRGSRSAGWPGGRAPGGAGSAALSRGEAPS